MNQFRPDSPDLPPQRAIWLRFRVGLRDYLDHLSLFSGNARWYLLGAFLTGVNFQVFLVLLNLYLKELGFPEGDIGLVQSSRATGMALMSIPAGIMLSRMRLKPLLISGCAVFAVSSFFIVSVPLISLMMAAALISGMAFSIFRVGAGPFFMRNSTRKERTYLFSALFGVNTLAGILGAFTAGRLAALIGEWTGDQVLGYQYTLYLGIAVGFLALIPFAIIRGSDPSGEEDKLTISRKQLRERGGFYLKFFVSNFLIGAGAGLTIPFLNLYFRDRFGLPPDTIGFYYAFVHLSMLVGTQFGPIIAKRFGLVRTVVITQTASLPFLATLSYSFYLPLAAGAFILRGGLMNLGQPITTTLGMELSQRSEQGLVNALLTVGWTSSWMVSTAVGGELIETYGYTVTMNLTILLYAVSTLTFYMFFRNEEKPNRSGPGWVLVHAEG
jgi:predicted MFS family arabinose efflux permease